MGPLKARLLGVAGVAAAGASAVLLAAAPAVRQTRYLFFWQGVPVGQLTLRWEPALRRFRYTSEHLFPRAAHRERTQWSHTWTLPETPGAALPEAFWLWRVPSAGCVLGYEERTGRRGQLCADRWSGAVLEGRVLGQPFTARYEAGELVSLTLPDARFEREDVKAPLPAPPDVLGGGFPVQGGQGPLGLDPPFLSPPVPVLRPWSRAAAQALAEHLHARASEGLEVQACLELAQAFVAEARARGHDAAVVTGLVLDGGQAFPHAWVEVADEGGRAFELDPALELPVRPETHLALARGGAGLGAGALYLDLFSGRRRVVRGLVLDGGGGVGK